MLLFREMSEKYEGFEKHELGGTHDFLMGTLPKDLIFDAQHFEEAWELHPEEYHEIKIHGRLVKTPRWQQAYGADYYYTNNLNKALPMPGLFEPVLQWCQETFDQRLNGLLVNWYDGKKGHYIGKHRDSTAGMIEGCPIIVISYGQTRTFRMRPYRGKGFTDFDTYEGSVFVIPYETNQAWTHEVPTRKGLLDRRISFTFRAFEEK